MSYLGTANTLAVAIILFLTGLIPGAGSETVRRGLAASPPLQERVVSQRPNPQAPAVSLGNQTDTRSDLTSEVDSLVDQALDLYSDAGLDLPLIDIIGFESPAECFGRSGAAIHNDRRTEIRLCIDGTGIADDWVVIHELAHAWDHNTLDDATRRVFLELRGLDSWRDGEWHERGAEHTAEIIVWGLIDRSVKPGRINQNSCAELLTGYETLTGGAPLHGHTDACD